MTDTDTLLRGRLRDLDKRAEDRDTYAYSEFLTLAEQELVPTASPVSEWHFDGGFDGAERKLAVFRGRDCIYEEEPPLCWLHIRPKDPRFAQTLGHRDYLGALLNLGIRREVLGDILTDGNAAYLVCLDTIAPFLCENLCKVAHTDVVCSPVEAPSAASAELPPLMRVVVASARLDALVAAVFHLSRSEAQEYFSRELVAVNGRPVASFTGEPPEGAIVSVRGKGRFRYEGVSGETRKGRLSAQVRLWGKT